MAQLTVRRGPGAGNVIELTAEEITIGRGSRNDIVLQDTDVSREHCRLFRQGNSYELEDLGSTRGTFVDGQPVVGTRRLRSGSIIELGDNITLEYRHTESRHNLPARPAEEKVKKPAAPDTADRFLVLSITSEVDRIYPLTDSRITVGRDLSNDIVIQDPEVSRWHLQLVRRGDTYTLEDLDSTNGTSINGHRVSAPQSLIIYDVIQLGQSIRLHYVRDVEDASKAVPAVRAVDMPKTKPFTVDPRETREAGRSNVIHIGGTKRQTSRLGTGMVPGALDGHVLVAYERADWEPLVAPLTVALQDAGIQVWVEQYLLANEVDRSTAIDQALSECWLLVLVVTPSALHAPDLRLQYRYFINREKPVVSLVYRPVERLPQELLPVATVSYHDDNPRAAFQRLILEILQRRA
jgi:pSer/pThr/pTyr-binding forkhead associated (FHA) protein